MYEDEEFDFTNTAASSSSKGPAASFSSKGPAASSSSKGHTSSLLGKRTRPESEVDDEEEEVMPGDQRPTRTQWQAMAEGEKPNKPTGPLQQGNCWVKVYRYTFTHGKDCNFFCNYGSGDALYFLRKHIDTCDKHCDNPVNAKSSATLGVAEVYSKFNKEDAGWYWKQRKSPKKKAV